MREHRSTSVFMTLVFLMGLAGCVADSAPKGGVPPFTLPPHLSLPGEFLIATALHGNPLFAAYGGGSVNDAINTAGSGVSAYTKYRLWSAGPQAPQYKFIETANGYSVMAFNGGGLATSNAIVTDLKGLPAGPNSAWGMFRFGRMGPNGVAITIQTSNGNFVTAVGGGGQLTNALHTDATTAQRWEYFYVTKCGDLGSGFTYALLATGSGLLSASGGGGRTQGAIGLGSADNSARFTLIRQADGTYALRTSNGINYVTAVGGGGRADDNTFHTDATQVQAWEKFRILDQGDCTYTIQTSNGGFVGGGGLGFATNLSAPLNPQSTALWRLYMFDL